MNRFIPTAIPDVTLIKPERYQDHRGWFSRGFHCDEFDWHGIPMKVEQQNISFNAKKGTLRGFHFQFPPAAEAKLIRCNSGSIFDVVIDLRPESPTYLQDVRVTLNGLDMLYIPERCAHAYLTLENNTQCGYLLSHKFNPELESGLPHDDPRFSIKWPITIVCISEKDKSWRPFMGRADEIRKAMTV
jgi:dTDP-4-dehydrorhamnose 3,5-epimerase